MSSWAALQRFLDSDPALVAADPDAARRYPSVAVHPAACGPCGEDFRGLLAAVTEDR